MSRLALEVADIFRDHGAAWRRANAGHVSLDQLKVMSAIERCRTAACAAMSRAVRTAPTPSLPEPCRNRHCPKCQGAATREWLAERETELLPVGYFHVVFTLPGPIADIAYQNKAVIYDLLLRVSAKTVLKIAADPKHLGDRIGITTVLHTWGSAMTHHPHVHMIVPGGGVALNGSRWLSGRRLPPPGAGFCRLFRGGSCKNSAPPTRPTSCSSSVGMPISPSPRPSRPIRRRCARSSGTSTQSLRSAAPRRCWLSLPLHPPRRHLQPPADRVQQQQCHLQVQGLSRRWPRALQNHDLCHR